MPEVEQMAKDLYRAMPGAPPVPVDGWDEAWGDVMGNQHWAFCEAIARMILANRPALTYER
jgi:hypothetical protein